MVFEEEKGEELFEEEGSRVGVRGYQHISFHM